MIHTLNPPIELTLQNLTYFTDFVNEVNTKLFNGNYDKDNNVGFST